MPRSAADRKQQLVAEFRRSEILVAATKVFANKGFEAAKMAEIAKAAKLAKGTLYRYFDSKDAVYEATVRQALTRLATLTDEVVRREPDFTSKLAAFISIRIAFWDEHQQLYRIILSINRQSQHRKRTFAWLQEAVLYLKGLYEEAAAAGEIPQQDFLSAAWAAMDAIRGVNERRAFSEHHQAADDTQFLMAFLLHGLRAKS
jgi:AcrR family transcriptional regulator